MGGEFLQHRSDKLSSGRAICHPTRRRKMGRRGEEEKKEKRKRWRRRVKDGGEEEQEKSEEGLKWRVQGGRGVF